MNPSLIMNTPPSMPMDVSPSMPMDVSPSIPMDVSPSIPMDYNVSTPSPEYCTSTSPPSPEVCSPIYPTNNLDRELTWWRGFKLVLGYFYMLDGDMGEVKRKLDEFVPHFTKYHIGFTYSGTKDKFTIPKWVVCFQDGIDEKKLRTFDTLYTDDQTILPNAFRTCLNLLDQQIMTPEYYPEHYRNFMVNECKRIVDFYSFRL